MSRMSKARSIRWRDAETVETELMLADLESLERRLPNLQKKAKMGDKDAKGEVEIVEPVLAALQAGKSARTVKFDDLEERRILHKLNLITSKPVLFVCNVEEASARQRQRAIGNGESLRQVAGLGRCHHFRRHRIGSGAALLRRRQARLPRKPGARRNRP